MRRLLATLLLLAACSSRHTRECTTASTCVQGGQAGMCVADGARSYCAYPDSMCAMTSQRWGVLADKAGQCVTGATPDGGVDATMLDASTDDAMSLDSGPSADAALPPQLALAPLAKDFGAVVIGMQSPEVSFSVSNTGGLPTGDLTVGIDGTNPGEFSVTANTCPGTALTRSGTCTIRVRYRPTTAGAQTAALHLTASPGGDVMADLSGSGITMGALTINPATQDFGGTLAGTMGAENTFTVRNTGQSATGVLTAAIQGGSDFVTTSNTCTGTLAGLATCTIKVRFQPQAAGASNGSLAVTDAAGGGTAAQLTGTGLTGAALALTPSPHDFGSLAIGGQTGTTDFTLQNSGGVATGVASVVLGDTANFAIASNGCTSPLAPGASCVVAVRFTPTAPAAGKTSMLTATATPGGSAAATVTGTALAQGALTIMPGSQSYGTVALGAQSAESTFTVMNTGGAATGTLAASLSGNDPGSFTISSNTCTAALAGGASCSIGVRFAPPTVGAKAASLGVTASPGGTVAVNLSGTGTALLTVMKTGTGTGSVGSAPGGITCGGTCSAGFSAASVTLTATPDPLSDLTSWSGGGCSGSGTCVVPMTAAAVVTATFTLKPPALTVGPASQDFGPVTIGSMSAPVTFTVMNTGGSPSGTLSAATGDAASYTVAGGTCVGMTLAAGASCTLTVRFNPVAPAGPKSTNLTVSGSPGGSAIAALTGSALSAGQLTLSPPSAAFGSIARGAMSAETVFTVMNTGGSPTGTLGVSLSDSANFTVSSNNCPTTLAAGASCMVGVRFTPGSVGSKQGVTLTASATPGGAIASTLGGTGTAQITVTNGGGGTVTSLPGGIACGATCTATFSSDPVALTAMADGTHTFGGWSGACTGSGACSVPLDAASKSVTATFNGISADVSVSQSAPASVLHSATLTYSLTISNAGPNPASAVTLTDTLPASVTYGSATPSQGSACTRVSTTVTCVLGAIASGSSATVSIVVTPNTVASITNSASVTATESDPTPANNTAMATTMVNAAGNLGFTAGSGAPNPVTVGSNVTYAYTVRNAGPDATTATFTDTLAASVTFVSANGTAGTCSHAGVTVTCTPGSIASGSSVTFNIIGTATAAGSIANSASVAGSVTDPDMSDNTGMVMVTANAQMFTLMVTKPGAGTGTVMSNTGGINCGGTCSGSYTAGTVVTLTAAATGSSAFTGWSGGGCTGMASTCMVTMNSAQTVMATFTPTFTLMVTKPGTGTGTVMSDTGGINCGATCMASYPTGTMVMLTAAPTGASTFGGWTGACSGMSLTCTVTMNSAQTATATFSTANTITVTLAGTNQGTVTSSPAGINCPGTCTAGFPSGTSVTLTSKAGGIDSAFQGWSGDCSGVVRTCTVVTNVPNRSATATWSTQLYNVAFMSSTSFAANLGSARTYDSRCNTLATAAGLNNATNDAYVAWMSDANSSAAAQIAGAGGFIRVDGRPFSGSASLLISSDEVFNTLSIDENGATGSGQVFTGSESDGTPRDMGTCLDWTTNMSAFFAGSGSTLGGPFIWTRDVSVNCSNLRPIYCLGKTKTTSLSPAQQAGKRIYFVRFFNGGGAGVADTACNTSKPGGVGAVLALLPTANPPKAASEVLNLATTYHRPDGQVVGTGAQIVAGNLESGPWQDAYGEYGGNLIATGSTAMDTVPASPTETCGDWTLTSGTAVVGNPNWTTSTVWNQSAFSGGCAGSGSLNVYCVEQ